MKIGGPKPPTPSPISSVKDPVAKGLSGEKTFAKALDGPSPVKSDEAPRSMRPVDHIIADLRAGKVDSVGAAHQMIDHIVATRGKHLSPELQQRLRAALESTLADDPTMISKMRRLGDAAEAEQ